MTARGRHAEEDPRDESLEEPREESRDEPNEGTREELSERTREESRDEREEQRDRRPRRVIRIALAVVAGLLVLGSVLWWVWSTDDVEVVTLHGVDYTTNVPIDEHGGYVYVYIPVNADVGDVVIEVENEEDNREIREFLDGLDTLIPGEHVVELSDSNLHVIVDGMEDEDDK